jgi:hypothetical protein
MFGETGMGLGKNLFNVFSCGPSFWNSMGGVGPIQHATSESANVWERRTSATILAPPGASTDSVSCMEISFPNKMTRKYSKERLFEF